MIKKLKTIKRKNCGTKCLGENYRSLDFVENNNFIIVSTEAAVRRPSENSQENTNVGVIF